MRDCEGGNKNTDFCSRIYTRSRLIGTSRVVVVRVKKNLGAHGKRSDDYYYVTFCFVFFFKIFSFNKKKLSLIKSNK